MSALSTSVHSITDDRSRRLGATATVDLRRLRSHRTWLALGLLVVATVGESLGTVFAGKVAAGPTLLLVIVLSVALIGSAIVDTTGRTMWAVVSDRAEGELRHDLLTAALNQPVAHLSETAVGEILDRVDDDTHEVGNLVRLTLWDALRVVALVVPSWIVAGLTWWPAWILFPIASVGAVWAVKPLTATLTRRKVHEEMAWTDHSAALEEGVAGRDDLRTSGGQAFAMRRNSELASAVHRAFKRVVGIQSRMTRRAGVLLYGMLAVITIVGSFAATHDYLDVARLVTLFLVSATFISNIGELAEQIPELQAGMGAVVRLRQMLATEPESTEGMSMPAGPIGVDVRGLDFSYPNGSFALSNVDLHIAAGTTCALVGRTGSGKSTLASVLSRAVEPQSGAVFLGERDVTDINIQRLRSAVGVVTQRTEILAGTLVDNITLFGPISRTRVEAAIQELRLDDWVSGLPQGLDTPLGAGGATLSAGEEQLVAFARLLVRDVRVVVLDEATARMDPLTEARVVAAADRLLATRTGVLIAHRLSTVARADTVVVLEAGRVIDSGPYGVLAQRPGPFRSLLDASGFTEPTTSQQSAVASQSVGGARRVGKPLPRKLVGTGPSLTRGVISLIRRHPRWGLVGAFLFLTQALTGGFGAITAWLWGRSVEFISMGSMPVLYLSLMAACLVASPIMLSWAIIVYTQWWAAMLLRVRTSVLSAQIAPHRLPRTPAGEVVARTLDADRYVRYADRWVDVTNGVVIVTLTTILGGKLLAGAVLLAVMLGTAVTSAIGRPYAGRSAAQASTTRAAFGRALVSALESARTVKLAAATDYVHAHLNAVDAGRVRAAITEHRVQSMLIGVPMIMVSAGVSITWAIYLAGGWGLATALLVSGAVSGFDWFGRVAGAVITEAPGTASWQRATSQFAGGCDLVATPTEYDLVAGTSPQPDAPTRIPLRRIDIRNLTAIHDDGTRGVEGVDLSIDAGDLVLLLGQVGSGKSSLLAAMSGLIDYSGDIHWNGEVVTDAELFLRPGQVSHVAQVPRVMSGTFAENIALDHRRDIVRAVADARLARDLGDAGGVEAIVGHRGVRLSGGQVQRVALARALATEAELLLADDVSSALDAATEIELWRSLRARGTAVLGATSKRAALEQADRVVVLVDGRVAEQGRWAELSPRWSHLAG